MTEEINDFDEQCQARLSGMRSIALPQPGIKRGKMVDDKTISTAIILTLISGDF
jgi:hypothetical protein